MRASHERLPRWCGAPPCRRAWPGSARRSSRRCRRWPTPPEPSTSGRGSPTRTAPSRWPRRPIAAIRAGREPVPAGLRASSRCGSAIAEHQARFWGIAVDPGTEVLVTAGATEAIAAAVLALCDPGDEILAFEPTYDSYRAVAAMAGARLRPVTLVPARLRGRRRRAGGARHRPHPAACCSTRRTTPPARCSPTDELAAIARALRRARPHRRHRRGVRAPRVRRRAPAARHLPGHGRAHAHDPLRGQDVLASPAGRSAGCAAPRSW